MIKLTIAMALLLAILPGAIAYNDWNSHDDDHWDWSHNRWDNGHNNAWNGWSNTPWNSHGWDNPYRRTHDSYLPNDYYHPGHSQTRYGGFNYGYNQGYGRGIYGYNVGGYNYGRSTGYGSPGQFTFSHTPNGWSFQTRSAGFFW